MTEIDFRTYYDLERHLFNEVSQRFENGGSLNAVDFFCIVIWKANRAKSKVAKRLLSHSEGYGTLNQAIEALTKAIFAAATPRAKLEIMCSEWGFRLPMASAVLTVLYPEEFTVYDVRVCNKLGNYHSAQNRTNFDNLWKEYAAYVQAVRKRGPRSFSLRDKDRWLWGKSFRDELRSDLADNFRRLKNRKM